MSETVTPLGTLGGPSEAYGISANGEVVVGSSGGNVIDFKAFRWEAGSMVNLPPPMTGHYLGSQAFAVSADGSIIVGTIYDEGSIAHAFIWDATGMQDMKTYLIGKGLNMDDWFLRAAYGVSDDGLTIVGTGSRNDPTDGWVGEGWIVTLDSPSPPVIPEPLTMLCVFGGIVGLGGYVRKRRMV